MKKSWPGGPRGWPVVGSLFEFTNNPLTFTSDLFRQYGEVASFDILGAPFVMFFHPRAVKNILIDNARNFTNREANPKLREIVGDGLLTIDGVEHRRQRRIVQPAFHRSRIERYASLMIERTERMLTSWRSGQEIDMSVAMSDLTLEIAGDSLFGADLGERAREIGQAFLAMSEYADLPVLSPSRISIDLPFTVYGKSIRARRRLLEIVETIIHQRRESGELGEDVLSMLLASRDDEGGGLDDVQVRDHILTFLAAGHATTANVLSWTFYLLSENPRVREKLTAELIGVLGGRAPSVEDLAHLPYLEMVINESMRLFPPAWAQARRASDGFDLEGYHFPAGTLVGVCQWVTHRRADLWGDPVAFRPERFAPDAPEPPPLSFFPFGGGPRTCIGMPFALLEARLLLATILQRYSPALVPGHPVEPRALIILQPRFGMRMQLAPTRSVVSTGPVTVNGISR